MVREQIYSPVIEPLTPDYVRRAATGAGTTDAAPFVFHDAGGRRWPRIKRISLTAAAALIVLAGAVVLAVTHVAPGRAPLFSGAAAPRVPDWPLRESGPAPAGPAAPAAGPGTRAGAAQPQPTAAGVASPSLSLRPTPPATGSLKPKRPRPTPHPLPWPF